MGFFDLWYKRFFRDRDVMKAFLQFFVKEKWVSELELDTLELTNKSFVNDDSKERHDDIIWKVKMKESDTFIYVYLMLEFQSHNEHFMAARMINYVSSFYLDLIHSQQFKKGEMLPPVLPVVIYRGAQKWSAPLNIKELVAAPSGELARYIPSMDYFILDENRVLKNELNRMNNIMAGLIKLEKSRTPLEGIEGFKEIMDLLMKKQNKERLVDFFYDYFILSQKRAKLITEDEVDNLHKLTRTEAIAMFAENMEEYRINLEEAARNQGIEKGIMETALKLKQEGLPVETIEKCTGLSAEQIENLK
jgi:predicted transposase/invertase (TIGR01784 family)